MVDENPLLEGHDEASTRLIRTARAFAADRVETDAARWELERRIDRDALREAAALGLTGIQVPREFGGQGASFRCKVAVTAVLARADFGFAMSLVNTHNVAAKLATEAAPEIAHRYVPDLLVADRLGSTALTEPHAGSDFPAITTRALPLPDGGWRLVGCKAWITNAAASDVIIAYAKAGEGDDAGTIASFVIDGRRAGFERAPPHALCGQHTIGTGGFALNDYRAGAEEMLAPPGRAFKAALTSINGARIYIAAMCCGMLERALEIAARHGRERTVFGRPLSNHQGWAWRLAEARAELAAVWCQVDRAARALDAGRDVMMAAAATKVAATRLAERHLPVMQHAMGAVGLEAAFPLGRHLMGMQVAGFVDGSTEMLLERLARDLARD